MENERLASVNAHCDDRVQFAMSSSCSSCGAAVDVSGLFPGGSIPCPSCGAKVTAGAPLGESKAPKPAPSAAPSLKAPTCPRCDADLDLRTGEDSVVVSVCTKGHGLFVTHKALREVKNAGAHVTRALDPDTATATAPIASASTTSTIRCPRCQEEMTRRSVARDKEAITIDVCPDHGTWFDAGELRAILDSHTASATAAANPALAKQAKATLDVALALEASREESSLRKGVDVAEDILDLVFDVPPRRRRWF